MSHTPTDSGIPALVADARNCAAKPDTLLQFAAPKLKQCADMIEAQAAAPRPRRSTHLTHGPVINRHGGGGVEKQADCYVAG